MYKKWSWLVIGGLLLVLLGMVLVGCSSKKPASQEATKSPSASQPAAAPQPAGGQTLGLKLGTTSSSSSHYAYMTAVSKSINDAVSNIKVTPVESGASVDNLKRIGNKEFDFGLAGQSVSYENYKGIGKFQGSPNPELRMMWNYTDLPLTMVTRTESNIKTVQGLEGKSFAAGGKGSSAEAMLTQIFELIGIHPKYYTGSYDDAADALSNKQIVGLAKWAANMKNPDALILRIEAQNKLNFLSFTPEQADKIKKSFPYMRFDTVKSGFHKTQNADTLNLIEGTFVVGTNRLTQEQGYQITKAVWKDQDRQAAAFPSIKATDYPELTGKSAIIPLHAGTVQLLKELGKEVPQSAIPPEYKGK